MKLRLNERSDTAMKAKANSGVVNSDQMYGDLDNQPRYMSNEDFQREYEQSYSARLDKAVFDTNELIKKIPPESIGPGPHKPVPEVHSPIRRGTAMTQEDVARMTTFQKASLLADLEISDGWQVLIHLLGEKSFDLSRRLMHDISELETARIRATCKTIKEIIDIPASYIEAINKRSGDEDEKQYHEQSSVLPPRGL